MEVIYTPQITKYLKGFSRLDEMRFSSFVIDVKDLTKRKEIMGILEQMDLRYKKVLELQYNEDYKGANMCLASYHQKLQWFIFYINENPTHIKPPESSKYKVFTWNSIFKGGYGKPFFDFTVESAMIWIQHSYNWMLNGFKFLSIKNYETSIESFETARFSFERCKDLVSKIKKDTFYIPDETTFEFCEKMSGLSKSLNYSVRIYKMFSNCDGNDFKKLMTGPQKKGEYCQIIYNIITDVSSYIEKISIKNSNCKNGIVDLILQQLWITRITSLIMANIFKSQKLCDDDEHKNCAVSYTIIYSIIKYIKNIRNANSELFDKNQDMNLIFSKLYEVSNFLIQKYSISVKAFYREDEISDCSDILTKAFDVENLQKIQLTEDEKLSNQNFKNALPLVPLKYC